MIFSVINVKNFIQGIIIFIKKGIKIKLKLNLIFTVLTVVEVIIFYHLVMVLILQNVCVVLIFIGKISMYNILFLYLKL